MKKSITKNFIYNLIKTLCSVIFPIITFAYTSRVIGVDGIGKINFARSFVMYFSMIAMLGINQYGTREAAKVRDNRKELSKFTKEILCINSITTIIALFLFCICMLSSEVLRQYRTLLLINSISVILQGLGMEWLYQALEEYKYISIRAIIFQVLSLIFMFVFVKRKEDVIPYAIINVFSAYGSLLINFFHARKYIDLKNIKRINLRKHVTSMLWLFAMAVSVELYTVLDTTMLGFLEGDTAVGLYTAAIKVNRIVNSVITALGVVLIPRLSYYIGNNEEKKFNILVNKGYNYVFMLSIPASIGLFLLSDDIIVMFSGSDFISAGFTMRIMTAIVILIPFSVMTNNQTLVPLGKERLIFFSTMMGAISNIISNSILIPRFGENGAAVGTVIAEGVVAIICFINAIRFFDMRGIFRLYYQYWIAALPIVGIVWVSKFLPVNRIIFVGLTVMLSAIWYVLALWLFKNEYFIDAINKIIRKRIHNA